MRLKLPAIIGLVFFITIAKGQTPNKELADFLKNYSEELLKRFPLIATSIGDSRYSNLLFADFMDSYRATLEQFYSQYLQGINRFDRGHLNANDKIS